MKLGDAWSTARLTSAGVGVVIAAGLLSSCQEKRDSAPPVSPSAVPTPTVTASATPAPYRVGGDVTAPRLITRVSRPVPEECQGRQFDGGAFIYEAVITEGGDVAEIRTLKAPSISPPCPQFEEQTRRAISQWKYEPAKLKGKPVRVMLTITQLIHFR